MQEGTEAGERPEQVEGGWAGLWAPSGSLGEGGECRAGADLDRR